MIRGQYSLDLAPQFGCLTSALACAHTTRTVCWLMRQQSFFTLCYLDDFVGVERSREKAGKAYAYFLHLARQLGLALALEKCVPPSQDLIWLSFHIDTVKRIETLP